MSHTKGGGPITDLYERVTTWWIGSDPGLLRLRMAVRTTLSLAASLGILLLLTKATGQPLTVALLGVLITMVASRGVNEPDPHRQRVTMALLPVPAALAITAGSLLAPHFLAGDVVFVLVVFGAVYVRRFGTRGRALGMVTFMAYFFTLYLRASISELPWMIGALVVGTICTFVMTTYLLPDRPDRLLRPTIRALRARMAIVVDTTAETVRTGRLDERRRRMMRVRTTRLNETALLVQSQIEDQAERGGSSHRITSEQLAPWLFDAELAIERVAAAGQQAAALGASPDIPAGTRAELVAALNELARAIRTPHTGGLEQAASQAQNILDRQSVADAVAEEGPGHTAVRRLALAIVNAATATAEARLVIEHGAIALAGTPASAASESTGPEAEPETGLQQTTRQAIQAAVAASLAIVFGELVSPARWFWAVIAAFVVFAGTNSWGETLTKGWQRLIGTLLGVPCGVLVATLLAGNTIAALAAIFVCLFCAFYFMTVTYSLMTFWITTMLALMYGLLGEFSFGVLLLRIEETAVGAVIGVTVAILVLPTHTRTAIRNDTRTLLTTLSRLIEISTAAMFPEAFPDAETGSPTEQARELDRALQQFRVSAKPLLSGVAGLASRRSIRRSLGLFTACDRHGRTLARNAEQYRDPVAPDPLAAQLASQLAQAFMSAAAQTQTNIDALLAVVDGAPGVTINSTTDDLDAAETAARCRDGRPRPDAWRFLTAVHALRQIQAAVVTAATDLGARAELETTVGAVPEGVVEG